MGYNRFGAVYTAVVALYSGTQAADFGGQTVIEESMDRAADRIANAMTEGTYKAMTEPQLELVVRRATAGLLTATLGIKPIVAGSLHVWSGQPVLFGIKPQLTVDQNYNGGPVELASTRFSVVTSTGVVTLTQALVADDVVYATYQADVTNAAFSMPSLARLVVRGAAAELGDKLYTESTQEWALVERYRKGFDDDLEALMAGTLVPDELRALRWWQEVDRTGPNISSVRLFRGG